MLKTRRRRKRRNQEDNCDLFLKRPLAHCNSIRQLLSAPRRPINDTGSRGVGRTTLYPPAGYAATALLIQNPPPAVVESCCPGMEPGSKMDGNSCSGHPKSCVPVGRVCSENKSKAYPLSAITVRLVLLRWNNIGLGHKHTIMI